MKTRSVSMYIVQADRRRMRKSSTNNMKYVQKMASRHTLPHDRPSQGWTSKLKVEYLGQFTRLVINPELNEVQHDLTIDTSQICFFRHDLTQVFRCDDQHVAE
eukprot:scpid21571/ scgid21308/ 